MRCYCDDEWAPLIFINAADSNGARLFSLLHETAHIWLGIDDLYNDRHNCIDGVSDLEVMCNAVAGELIVPKRVFWTIGMMGQQTYMRLLRNWQDISDVGKL